MALKQKELSFRIQYIEIKMNLKSQFIQQFQDNNQNLNFMKTQEMSSKEK